MDATLLKLDPPGPYETPTIEAWRSLEISQGQLPPRVVLVLSNGAELRVPMNQDVLELFRDRLNEMFPPESLP